MQRGLETAGLGHSVSLPSLSTYGTKGMLWLGLGSYRDVALNDRSTLGTTTAMVLGAESTVSVACLPTLCRWAFSGLWGHFSSSLTFPAFLCSFVLWVIPSFPTFPITEFSLSFSPFRQGFTT